MTTPTMLICPVGHPSGPGQSFCPLCGRDNITVEAPVTEAPAAEVEVPAQAPPVEPPPAAVVEPSPFAELHDAPPPPPPVVEAGPAPHYAPNKTHFWDGLQWLPGHLGPQ